MIRQINVGGIKWIDGVGLERKEIYDVLKEYDFHELDVEAAMEENQRARIDSYEDYFFVIFHFPKYNSRLQIYELNEFNIFVGKDFLITFRNFSGQHIDAIFEKYSELDIEGDISIKVSSGFILYEIIQAMLEKMFRAISNLKRELKNLEKNIFENVKESFVRDIMVRKRSIIILKNMMKPQIAVMHSLETSINDLFKGIMEVYFEDLEDKIGYIVNDINILEEHIASVEDALTTMIDIKTSSVIRLLTMFSAFILPLTLITSFYGMNISLPFQNNVHFVYSILIGSIVVMFAIYSYYKKMGKM